MGSYQHEPSFNFTSKISPIKYPENTVESQHKTWYSKDFSRQKLEKKCHFPTVKMNEHEVKERGQNFVGQVESLKFFLLTPKINMDHKLTCLSRCLSRVRTNGDGLRQNIRENPHNTNAEVFADKIKAAGQPPIIKSKDGIPYNLSEYI